MTFVSPNKCVVVLIPRCLPLIITIPSRVIRSMRAVLFVHLLYTIVLNLAWTRGSSKPPKIAKRRFASIYREKAMARRFANN